MDQTRIGTFIAVLRKEKGLTQKELAEQIGISDKTVSKWETGNGMPDIAYLSPLCEVLDINVNELLSGEKLPSEEYLGKAEENMKHLMQENQNNKNAGRWQGLVGIALLAVAVFLAFWFAAGENRLVCGLPVPHPYSMYLCGVRAFQWLPDKI